MSEYSFEKQSFPVKHIRVRRTDCDYADFCLPPFLPGNGNGYVYLIHRVSDIIDGSGGETAQSTTQKLLAVLTEYKGKSDLLCRMLSEWICDVCLIGGELSYLSELFGKGLRTSLTSDFLVGGFICAFSGKGRENICERLMCALPYMCDYDYEMSEPYRKNPELYVSVVTNVVLAVLECARDDETISLFELHSVTKERRVYRGLTNKCKNAVIIELEYLSQAENSGLRALVTAAAKYADNLVRQGLGIKSKLPCTGLLPQYRQSAVQAVRQAYPELLPKPARVGRKPKPESEKKSRKSEMLPQVPEPIDLNIDFAKARQLEAESWRLAELVGAEYDGALLSVSLPEISAGNKTLQESAAEEDEQVSQSSENICDAGEWSEFLTVLTEKEMRVLECILCGGDAVALSRSLGGMLHGFADAINEKAQDTYGDIIMEAKSDGGFCVFGDYAQELSEIINKDAEVV